MQDRPSLNNSRIEIEASWGNLYPNRKSPPFLHEPALIPQELKKPQNQILKLHLKLLEPTIYNFADWEPNAEEKKAIDRVLRKILRKTSFIHPEDYKKFTISPLYMDRSDPNFCLHDIITSNTEKEESWFKADLRLHPYLMYQLIKKPRDKEKFKKVINVIKDQLYTASTYGHRAECLKPGYSAFIHEGTKYKLPDKIIAILNETLAKTPTYDDDLISYLGMLFYREPDDFLFNQSSPKPQTNSKDSGNTMTLISNHNPDANANQTNPKNLRRMFLHYRRNIKEYYGKDTLKAIERFVRFNYANFKENIFESYSKLNKKRLDAMIAYLTGFRIGLDPRATIAEREIVDKKITSLGALEVIESKLRNNGKDSLRVRVYCDPSLKNYEFALNPKFVTPNSEEFNNVTFLINLRCGTEITKLLSGNKYSNLQQNLLSEIDLELSKIAI